MSFGQPRLTKPILPLLSCWLLAMISLAACASGGVVLSDIIGSSRVDLNMAAILA